MNTLEIIDRLCNVTNELSDLVRALNTELQQSEIAGNVKEEMMQKKEVVDQELDSIEYKLRRAHMWKS